MIINKLSNNTKYERKTEDTKDWNWNWYDLIRSRIEVGIEQHVDSRWIRIGLKGFRWFCRDMDFPHTFTVAREKAPLQFNVHPVFELRFLNNSQRDPISLWVNVHTDETAWQPCCSFQANNVPQIYFKRRFILMKNSNPNIQNNETSVLKSIIYNDNWSM